MQQLFLLLRTFPIFFGFTALVFLIIICIKTKDKYFYSFLFFMFSFTISYLFNVLYKYGQVNLQETSHILKNTIKYLRYVFQFPFMLSIPFFTHSLIKARKIYIRNIIIFSFIIIIFLIHDLLPKFVFFNSYNSFIKEIDDIGFIIINIYSFLVILFNYKKIKDKEKKYLINTIFIFYIFFLPLIILDGLDVKFITDIPLSPIIYTGFSIITITFMYRFYIKSKDLIDNLSIIESKLSDAEISNREKDIILLILKGYSNKNISKTLSITEGTVKIHNNKIFKKLNVTGRYDLITSLMN